MRSIAAKQPLALGIAEKFELIGAGHAEAAAADLAAAPSRPPSRPRRRENGSAASKPAATSSTSSASSAVSAKIETQSSERQAGTTPRVLIRPRVGLRPMRLLKAAGTRPEPAVSVPSEKLTSPAATATAEPELDPPGM